MPKEEPLDLEFSFNNKNNKNIEFVFSDEIIIPDSGLTAVGAVLSRSEFIKRCGREKADPDLPGPQARTGDVFLTYIGLLCMGRSQYASVRMSEDSREYLRYALGLTGAVPGEEELRQGMESVGDSMREMILQGNLEMLRLDHIVPSPLPDGFVPVDICVAPFDTAKSRPEGVPAAEAAHGYAAAMAYIGLEGYLVNTELRPGEPRRGLSAPDFLRETVTLCRQLTDAPLLFRLDACHDSEENMGVLLEAGCSFIIQRDLSGEDTDSLFERIKENAAASEPREGKTVYVAGETGTVNYTTEAGETTGTVRTVAEAAESVPEEYDLFLFEPDREVSAWRTDLDIGDVEILRLYSEDNRCEKHSGEIKKNMDVERLPSGSPGTGALALELTIPAYNILRMVSQGTIGGREPDPKRRTGDHILKRTIDDMARGILFE